MRQDAKIRSDKPFGVAWAEHEALLRGIGKTRADLDKPQIAVINSWSEINPGHMHLNPLAEQVKQGVLEAGGQPYLFNVLGLCDGVGLINSLYLLPSRDLIANEIEVYVECYGMDAMVMLGTCDKIIPAFMMAAARLDIPAIIVTGGYMAPGIHPKTGERLSFVDVGRAVGQTQAGNMSREELDIVLDHACPGPGACPMMGTANTMCILAETVGLSLPGNSTTPATSPEMPALAKRAGKRVVEMWNEGVTARDIVTKDAIRNVICVDMAIGGSTNSLIHVPAVATEADLDMVCLDHFDEMSHSVPLLMGISPNGPHLMDDFDRAGGLRALMNEIRPLLNLEARTVSGKTVGENIEGHTVTDNEVIRTMANPLDSQGGLAVLKGSLAPGGAIVKASAVPENLRTFKGPAKVFRSNEEAIAGLREGKVLAGDAMIIIFQGCKGGPGLNSTFVVTSELAGMDIGDKVAIITDGRFSGATEGASIGYISPEAAQRGPLLAIHDGDYVEFDIEKRTIDILLLPEVIEERCKNTPVNIRYRKGYIGIYQKTVQPVSTGAVLRGVAEETIR